MSHVKQIPVPPCGPPSRVVREGWFGITHETEESKRKTELYNAYIAGWRRGTYHEEAPSFDEWYKEHVK